ncbi:hypothetical protein RQP46_005233 [Phenoliferia psychrophenolica]
MLPLSLAVGSLLLTARAVPFSSPVDSHATLANPVSLLNNATAPAASCDSTRNGTNVDMFETYTIRAYFGPIVGRYANRIRNSNETYHITPNENNGEDTLHGGLVGTSHSAWSLLKRSATSLIFGLLDSNGTEGFPGTVYIKVNYTVSSGGFWTTTIHADAYDPTPLLLSSHVYWNLDGYIDSQTILNHTLFLKSSRYIEADGIEIPTGVIGKLKAGDPLYFGEAKKIGKQINDTLGVCGTGCIGVDTCFIYDDDAKKDDVVMELASAASGIKLSVRTNQVAGQVYTCSGQKGQIKRKASQGGPTTADTMSSNAEDTPKTTLTSLPTELITRIVRLSSPKPSWDNSVERSAHLRNLALVCRTLRGPAQEELFRHVVLPSVAASRAFVAVLKSRAGARFASTPRSLRAGVGGDDWIGQDKLALPFIVKRCSRLESLWLFEVDALDVARLVSGTVVKELYCVGCTLCAALRDRKLEAPALVRLGLSTCENLGYLDPGCFPKLKSLDTSIFDLDPSEIIDLIAFLNSLGGQLSSLGTDCQDVGVPKIQSELFTSLRVLDIGLPLDDLPPFLNSIPSHIRHLRAQMWPLEDLHLTEYGWADKLITEHLGEDQYPVTFPPFDSTLSFPGAMSPSSYDYIRARVVALDARGDWTPEVVSDVLGITLEQYRAVLSNPQTSSESDEDEKVRMKLKIKLEIKEEEREGAALRTMREGGVQPTEGETPEGRQDVPPTNLPSDSASTTFETRDVKRRKEGGDFANPLEAELDIKPDIKLYITLDVTLAQNGAISSFDNPPHAAPPKALPKGRTGPKKVRILLTGLGIASDSPEMINWTAKLARLGAKFTEEPKEATHLVIKGITRTEKFLCTLAFAPFIVTRKWIDDSVAGNMLLDEEEYLLHDAAKERELGETLEAIVGRARAKKLFSDHSFYLTPNLLPSVASIRRVIECGGGFVSMNTTDRLAVSDNVHVVSSPRDRYKWEKYAKNRGPVYSVEAIFQSVVHQELRFSQDYRIDAQL